MPIRHCGLSGQKPQCHRARDHWLTALKWLIRILPLLEVMDTSPQGLKTADTWGRRETNKAHCGEAKWTEMRRHQNLMAVALKLDLSLQKRNCMTCEHWLCSDGAHGYKCQSLVLGLFLLL